MASIHALPWELMHVVVGRLDDVNDIVSLARVRSDIYTRVMNDICAPTQFRILMWACTTGATRVVNRILDAGLSANIFFGHNDLWYYEHCDPTFYFASQGLTDVSYGEPDTEDHAMAFWKPLHVAVRYGHSDIVGILLDKNAWVDAPSLRFSPVDRPLVESHRGRNTPLHLALCEGQEDIAKALILKGASIYVDHFIEIQEPHLYPERSRMSAFHLCAFKGLVSTAKLLIDMGYGTAIDELDEYGCSPLMHAYHFEQDEFLHFLLAQGARPRINQRASCPVEFRCRELIQQACWDNRWELVVKLSKHITDPIESGSESEGLQLLYFCIDNFKPLRGWDIVELELDEDDEIEMQKMISTIESCRMHIVANRETLNSVLAIAVKKRFYPVLSFLLDTGLDAATMIDTTTATIEGSWPHARPWHLNRDYTRSEPTTFDLGSYYDNTGAKETCLSMLDFACYTFQHTRNAQKTIGVLLAQGCMESGELGCYVRVLKNLCCHVFNVYLEDDEDQTILRHCAQAICSQLSDKLINDSQKPKMPFDLLYVCTHLGQDVILDESTNIFETDYAVYNEAEISQLFDAMRNRDFSREERTASCAEILLREDKNGRLLQNSRTFETLCDIFLGHDSHESVILYYLDRGGCYNLTFKDGRTALFAAISSGYVKAAERFLDLGADPNKLLTRSVPNCWRQSFMWEARNPAFMRLLVHRGFNPSRLAEDNSGLNCLWKECLRQRDPDYEEFELFQELCHTINNETDDGDLFYLLDIACYYGRYTYIQEICLHAKDRVDAMIREKAALFLQRLLINISPASDHRIVSNDSTIMDMDDIIDTMGLILRLGPRSTLTSSWRLKEGRDDFTALKILQKLLTPPPNPHAPPGSIHDRCHWEERLRYRVYWCLNERVKITSESGEHAVTISDQRIEWPDEFHGVADSWEYAEKMHGIFARIRPPWGCFHWYEDE